MRSRLKQLLAAILLCGVALSVQAQHNPYKIDDPLYEYFLQMVKMKHDPICLKMTDTLYIRAFARGDRKAQCLAYTIPVNYRFGIPGHYPEMKAACDELRKVARQTGYMRYYYFASSNEVTYLLNEGHTAQAVRLAKRMHDEATSTNELYGIYSSTFALGNIYYSHRESEKALEYYTKAYDHLVQCLPDQDDTQVLSRMAACYADMDQADDALRCARQALETAKTETALMRALEQDLTIFYKFNRPQDFMLYYRVAQELIPRTGYAYRSEWYQVEACRYIYEGNYALAHECAEKSGSFYECALLHSEIYRCQGNFEQAYVYADKANKEAERILHIQQNQDLDEMEAQARREQLAEEAQVLHQKQQLIEASRHRLRVRLAAIVVLLAFLWLGMVTMVRHRAACALAAKNKELEAARQVAVAARGVAEKARHVAEKARRAAEEARDKAELADRMKTVFVQNMSHEIRTPLNAIVGFSAVLTDPSFNLPQEERKDLGDRIAQNSDLLTTLINDILDLSNLESGKYMMELAPVAVNSIVSNAIDTVMYRKPADVNLHFDSDAADDFMINTDAMRVQQVIINFLTNAEKNTDHGEITLHCSVKEHPGFVTFSVEDTGIGVPPEEAEHIFERFAKLDNFKQGSGLGLSICSVISDRLGGHVFLDTTYKGGARFVFEVPMGGQAA
jgi:signal transduction histidine kinase